MPTYAVPNARLQGLLLPAPPDRPDGLGAAGPAGGPGAWRAGSSPDGPPESRRLAVAGRRGAGAGRGGARLPGSIAVPEPIRRWMLQPEARSTIFGDQDPSALLRHAGGRRADRHSSTCSTCVLLVLVLWLSMAWSFTEEWGEYFALMFWATVGMMLLTASEELVTLFLTLETMTICLYLSTALREDETAVGGGGLEVLRLRLGLLGAVPVRAEPGLRPDGDDPVRRDPG